MKFDGGQPQGKFNQEINAQHRLRHSARCVYRPVPCVHQAGVGWAKFLQPKALCKDSAWLD